jgi:3-oxoacyl-[acyl-carrier protein] reductase
VGPPNGFVGKVALVTGASGALGAAIAHRLAAGGAGVACHYYTNQAQAEAVLAQVRAAGADGRTVRADVTSAADVDAMLQQVLDAWGRLDVLVHAAGITRDALLLRMEEAQWDSVLATNLKSAFLCTRAALRPMLRQRAGRILYVSSVIGIAGNSGQANYAAAKAGLLGLTRSTAKEVASRGITVNALAPGFIDAGMTASLGAELRQKAAALVPLGRFGAPEDVAEAAAFLCSDAAGYITGQVLQVDGGLVMG